MGEALLRRALTDRGIESDVASAGLLESGRPNTVEVIRAMAPIGIDLNGRTSHQIAPDDVEAADLILTMERAHLRHVVVLVPKAAEKTFTLKELVRRGEAVGGRGENETIEQWFARVNDGRELADLQGRSSADDVEDPFGQELERYEAARDELDELTGRLVDLLWPVALARPEPFNADR